jgi:hypothetical protein
MKLPRCDRNATAVATVRNVACHSTKIGKASTGSTYTPGGWNKVTPW